MEKFKEYVTMVQRGDGSDNIIGSNVYSNQSYGTKIGTNTGGCNTWLESISSEGRIARKLTHY